MSSHPQTKMEAPCSIRVAMPGGKRCRLCLGPAVFVASVGTSGWSAGDDHDHGPTCPNRVCPCGVPWSKCVVDHTDEQLDAHFGREVAHG